MCRFCDIRNGNFTYNEIDKPFFANKDFFAIASIGALVEGWTLIIPNEHQMSMRNLYAQNTFFDITNNIIKVMQSKYGKVIAFEHGSYMEKSPTSCGTDHAHLHLVPTESLMHEIQSSGLLFIKCKASEIAMIAENNEYLFYCEVESEWNNQDGYLHILDKPISQFFRRLIASKLNISTNFDYRLFPNIDNAQITQQFLSNYFFQYLGKRMEAAVVGR